MVCPKVPVPDNQDMCVDNFPCCTIRINTNSFRLVMPFGATVQETFGCERPRSVRLFACPFQGCQIAWSGSSSPARGRRGREKERKCFPRIWGQRAIQFVCSSCLSNRWQHRSGKTQSEVNLSDNIFH